MSTDPATNYDMRHEIALAARAEFKRAKDALEVAEAELVRARVLLTSPPAFERDPAGNAVDAAGFRAQRQASDLGQAVTEHLGLIDQDWDDRRNGQDKIGEDL